MVFARVRGRVHRRPAGIDVNVNGPQQELALLRFFGCIGKEIASSDTKVAPVFRTKKNISTIKKISMFPNRR